MSYFILSSLLLSYLPPTILFLTSCSVWDQYHSPIYSNTGRFRAGRWNTANDVVGLQKRLAGLFTFVDELSKIVQIHFWSYKLHMQRIASKWVPKQQQQTSLLEENLVEAACAQPWPVVAGAGAGDWRARAARRPSKCRVVLVILFMNQDFIYLGHSCTSSLYI